MGAGGSVTVQKAKVVQADVAATNGVVHVINGVLTPPSTLGSAEKNIVELAAGIPDLSTLVTALTAGKLVTALSGTGPFTVFAPTNEAFAALPAATLASLLKPANIKQLDAILEYHVIAGAAVRAEDLKASQDVKTLEGQKLHITKVGGSVTVQKAKVITADVAATNGVVHVINGVLMPPAPLFCMHQEDTVDHKCFEACAPTKFAMKGIHGASLCPSKYNTVDKTQVILQCPDGLTSLRYCPDTALNVTVKTKGEDTPVLDNQLVAPLSEVRNVGGPPPAFCKSAVNGPGSATECALGLPPNPVPSCLMDPRCIGSSITGLKVCDTQCCMKEEDVRPMCGGWDRGNYPDVPQCLGVVCGNYHGRSLQGDAVGTYGKYKTSYCLARGAMNGPSSTTGAYGWKLAGAHACSSDAKNIVELAAGIPDLSTLVTALKAGKLVTALSGTGPFTVFAPTNEAFAALP